MFFNLLNPAFRLIFRDGDSNQTDGVFKYLIKFPKIMTQEYKGQ